MLLVVLAISGSRTRWWAAGLPRPRTGPAAAADPPPSLPSRRPQMNLRLSNRKPAKPSNSTRPLPTSPTSPKSKTPSAMERLRPRAAPPVSPKVKPRHKHTTQPRSPVTPSSVESTGYDQQVPTTPTSPGYDHRVPTTPTSPGYDHRVPTTPTSPGYDHRVPTTPTSPGYHESRYSERASDSPMGFADVNNITAYNTEANRNPGMEPPAAEKRPHRSQREPRTKESGHSNYHLHNGYQGNDNPGFEDQVPLETEIPLVRTGFDSTNHARDSYTTADPTLAGHKSAVHTSYSANPSGVSYDAAELHPPSAYHSVPNSG